MTQLTLPRLAGSRDLVLRLLAQVPLDLAEASIIVDAHGLESAAPSFADELCKELLVTRRAMSLTVRHASENLRRYLVRSADNRDVSDRLIVETRTEAL